MSEQQLDRIALDAFSLAIRVICHAWNIDPPASEFERPWALLREIADGATTLSSPAEMAARFPALKEFVYESSSRVIEHDRQTARHILQGLAGAF